MNENNIAILRSASRFCGLALTSLAASCSRSANILSKPVRRDWPASTSPDHFIAGVQEHLPPLTRRQARSVFRESRMLADEKAKDLLGFDGQYRWAHFTIWARTGAGPTMERVGLEYAIDLFFILGTTTPDQGPYAKPEYAAEFLDAGGTTHCYYRSDGAYTEPEFSRAVLCDFAHAVLLPRLAVAFGSERTRQVLACDVPPFGVGCTSVDSPRARVVTVALPPTMPLDVDLDPVDAAEE